MQFRIEGDLVERGVLNEQGGISGRAQSAVRPISSDDFNRIVAIGLPDEPELLPRSGAFLAEEQAAVRNADAIVRLCSVRARCVIGHSESGFSKHTTAAAP